VPQRGQNVAAGVSPARQRGSRHSRIVARGRGVAITGRRNIIIIRTRSASAARVRAEWVEL
jgi:hypothetical protein